MPRKVFVAGEILTAADVNTNLMDQAVMSFASSAARGSAIPTPVEGMASYLNDQNVLSLYDGSAWQTSLATTGGILQVVQTVKTDAFTTTSPSYVDITGFSVTITPKSTTSKVLILLDMKIVNHVQGVSLRLQGGNSGNYIGDAAGSRIRALTGFHTRDNDGYIQQHYFQTGGVYLDSPATTSAVTYKVQVACASGANNEFNFNRSENDTDTAGFSRPASSITAIEVAA